MALDIESIINSATTLFDNFNQGQAHSNTQGAYEDWIKQDFEQQKREHEAANAYNEQYHKYLEDMNQYKYDAAAGRAGAANANAAARRDASMRANEKMAKVYGRLKDQFRPYKQTADRLLPQMEGAYTQGLDLTSLLSQYLQGQGLDKLNTAKPASQQYIPLPGDFK